MFWSFYRHTCISAGYVGRYTNMFNHDKLPVFQTGCTIVYLYQQGMWVPVASYLHQLLLRSLKNLCHFRHSGGWTVVSHWGFNLHLIYWPLIYIFCEWLYKYLAHFWLDFSVLNGFPEYGRQNLRWTPMILLVFRKLREPLLEQDLHPVTCF